MTLHPDKSRWLNVSESLFHRVWKVRLGKIVKEIQVVEEIALGEVRNYLTSAR